ncbi:MAG: OmpA family protein [Bacteroidetes bacterium]|nr:OmpA family protein [Bacteroidota bacterium]
MKQNRNKSYIQKTILTFIVCMIGLSFTLTAQTAKPDTVKAYIGPYLGYNLNIHFADFKIIPDCVSCNPENYGTTLGGGFAFGGLFEYLLYKEGNRTPMSIGVRVGYSDVGASLSTEEAIGNTPNLQVTNTTLAYSKHNLTANIAQINVAPYLAYYFTDAFIGNIGLNIGYMMTKSYEYWEELDRPDYAIFLHEESRIRNRKPETDIPDASSLQLGLMVGVGYEFPIGKYSKIMPEIQYNFNLNKVASDLDWRTNTIRIGAGLKFALIKPAFIPPEIFYQRDTSIEYKRGITEPEIVLIDTRREKQGNDTLIIENYIKYLPKTTNVSSNLSYYAIMDDQKVPNPTVVIEEYEVTESFAFLPIVYFEDGSAELSKTKQNLIQKDDIASFNYQGQQDVFSLYYNMLNVLGQRMRRFANARIDIMGFSSGVNEDAKNKNISSQRANAVKDYLVNVWGVSSDRIKTSLGTPPKRNPAATQLSYNDVVEESQRVLIQTNDLDLILPIVITDLEKKATPEEVIFELVADAEEGIKNYNLTLKQDANNLREFADAGGNVEKLNTTKTWKVLDAPIPLLEANVNAVFNVTDDANQKSSSSQNVTVRQITVRNKKAIDSMDIKIERYSLCLFEFDKATSTPIHRRVLSDIRYSIKPNSKLYINGYADRVGDKQHNMDLATRRMEVVNDALNPDKKLDAILEAIGNTILLYDNDTPEGRAFSRTVKIEIHTPTK